MLARFVNLLNADLRFDTVETIGTELSHPARFSGNRPDRAQPTGVSHG